MAKEKEEPGTQEGGAPPSDAVDWKAQARKWEERAKANYDKAKAYDEAEEARKSDLQKALEESERLKEELDGVRRKAELDAIRARVAKEAGVPESLVTGDDEESMAEFAKAVAAFAKPDPAPKTPATGKFASDGGGEQDAKAALARQMFGRNDS